MERQTEQGHRGALSARALVLLVAAGCAPRAARGVLEPTLLWPRDTQVHWYEVSGQTPQALRGELDRLGPEGQGRHHDAYTAWWVTWRYPFTHVDGGCAIGPVETTLKVQVTLPRWRPAGEVSGELVERWRAYLEALTWHESGHRDTGLRAEFELRERLEALPPQATCDEADRRATEAAQAVLARHRAADAEYDEETRHGATQGATFP